MTEREFIFSNERKYLLIRHLSFWIAFSVACFFTGAYPNRPKDLLNFEFYIVSLIWVACFLPVSILLTYFFLQFVLPVLSKKGNFFKILLAMAIAFLFNIIVSCLLSKIALMWYYQSNKDDILHNSLQLAYLHSIIFTVLLTCSITVVIVIKKWHLQVSENTQLYRQKIYNELNVLKAQVYPAFLFNSLTILRRQLDRSSTDSAILLLNLSDILSYILYDSGDERVLMKKEIITLKNFIELVNHERKNPIVLESNISEECYDRYIPPLVLFSLLEAVLSVIKDQTEEENYIHISMSEKNWLIEFTVSCIYEKSRIYEKFTGKEIKQIQDRLKIFPMTDHKLIIFKNETSIDFSIWIEPTATFNFSNNELYLQN